jgi:dephospho-CoA kinase
MLVLGLTGVIAAGKSTVAGMFGELGAAVFDADAAVHALYRAEGVAPVGAAFPGVLQHGAVDRARLSALIAANPAALARLEAIVHPLVREREAAFRARAAEGGRRVAVLDIPLLFETGGEARVDATVVVTAPAAILRQRLSARGMDEASAAALAARQMSDEAKRRRAHFIVDTAGPLADTRRAVAALLRALSAVAAGR